MTDIMTTAVNTQSLRPDAKSQLNKISICIPTFNEADNIGGLIEQCFALTNNDSIEIIIADGGSSDSTQAVVQSFSKQLPVTFVSGAKGRAAQMNLAASHAKHNCLWFLHADTHLPPNLDISTLQCLQEKQWGRFNVRLSGEQKAFRMIGFMINFRSRLTSVSTGDQGLFIHRSLFNNANGFADIALMEDVELTKRLRKFSKPLNLTQHVITSSRRWQKKGITKTIVLMWWLRLAYVCGVSPKTIQAWYR